MDDVIAMRHFDKERLQRIGSGSDRVVFALDDDKNALKVAKTPRGLQQNMQETDWISGVEPQYVGKDFVVVQLADKPSLQTKRMLKDLSQFSQKDFDEHTSELQDALSKYGLDDYGNYDLEWGDFTRPSSWGEVNGQPVLVDKGALSRAAIKSREPWADREWEDIKRERRAAKREGRQRLFATKMNRNENFVELEDDGKKVEKCKLNYESDSAINISD
jgi:hypothetical protein